jgi:hypothetical protein
MAGKAGENQRNGAPRVDDTGEFAAVGLETNEFNTVFLDDVERVEVSSPEADLDAAIARDIEKAAMEVVAELRASEDIIDVTPENTLPL